MTQHSLKPFQIHMQPAEFLRHRVAYMNLIQICIGGRPLAIEAHDPGRNAYRGGIGWNLIQDYCSCGHPGVIPHFKGTQHFGACAYQHVVA